MVEVPLDHLQKVDHVPLAGDGHLALARADLIVGNGVNELHELFLVLFIASLELCVDGSQDGVLMGGIPEHGAVVLGERVPERTYELKVREAVLLGVEPLSLMTDGSVLLDHMM